MRFYLIFGTMVLAALGSLFCSKTLTEEELFTKAQEELKEKNQVEAVRSYERIVENFPESENRSKALFMLGFLYANELQDTDKARSYYSQMLQEYPDHELAVSVEFELENLGKAIEEMDSILVKKIEIQDAAMSNRGGKE